MILFWEAKARAFQNEVTQFFRTPLERPSFLGRRESEPDQRCWFRKVR